jgi:hypothetical protein
MLEPGSAGIVPERFQHCIPQQYRVTLAAFCQFNDSPSDHIYGWVLPVNQTQGLQGVFKCRGNDGHILRRERAISEKGPNRHARNPPAAQGRTTLSGWFATYIMPWGCAGSPWSLGQLSPIRGALAWLQEHARHIAALGALIGHETWIASSWRNPQHFVHLRPASRAWHAFAGCFVRPRHDCSPLGSGCSTNGTRANIGGSRVQGARDTSLVVVDAVNDACRCPAI